MCSSDLVLAAAALFVALDGPTQAAGMVTGKQIKNSSVTGKDIKDESLTGGDVAEASLAKVPSATLADTATTATSATTASGVAPNAITGASVANGTLTADDISVGHGRFTLNLGSVAPNACNYEAIEVGPDMQNAAIVVTPESPLGPLDISVTTVHSDSPGFLRLVMCNPTAAAVDPPSATFDYIAFNVVP